MIDRPATLRRLRAAVNDDLLPDHLGQTGGVIVRQDDRAVAVLASDDKSQLAGAETLNLKPVAVGIGRSENRKIIGYIHGVTPLSVLGALLRLVCPLDAATAVALRGSTGRAQATGAADDLAIGAQRERAASDLAGDGVNGSGRGGRMHYLCHTTSQSHRHMTCQPLMLKNLRKGGDQR